MPLISCGRVSVSALEIAAGRFSSAFVGERLPIAVVAFKKSVGAAIATWTKELLKLSDGAIHEALESGLALAVSCALNPISLGDSAATASQRPDCYMAQPA